MFWANYNNDESPVTLEECTPAPSKEYCTQPRWTKEKWRNMKSITSRKIGARVPQTANLVQGSSRNPASQHEESASSPCTNSAEDDVDDNHHDHHQDSMQGWPELTTVSSMKGWPKLTTISSGWSQVVLKLTTITTVHALLLSTKNKTTTATFPILYPGHPLSKEGDENTMRSEAHRIRCCDTEDSGTARMPWGLKPIVPGAETPKDRGTARALRRWNPVTVDVLGIVLVCLHRLLAYRLLKHCFLEISWNPASSIAWFNYTLSGLNCVVPCVDLFAQLLFCQHILHPIGDHIHGHDRDDREVLIR